MKLGMNHPMGPLALADLIGLDTCLYIMETLHEGLAMINTGLVRSLNNMSAQDVSERKRAEGFIRTKSSRHKEG